MLPVFAAEEVSAGSPTLIGAVISAFLGCMGLLAWVLRHVLAVTIPDMQKAHQEQLAEERKANKEQNAEERKGWQEQAAKDRELFGQMYTGVLARLEDCNDTAKQARDSSLACQAAVSKSVEGTEKMVRTLVKIVRTAAPVAAAPAKPA